MPIRVCLLIMVGWYPMLVCHEAGHVLHAWVSGGRVERVTLDMLVFSRTDASPNPHPAFVAWGGAIWGAVIPLALWGMAGRARARGRRLLAAFAGFCLLVNGVYPAAAAVMPVGDAEDLMRLGVPRWVLAAAGLMLLAGAGLVARVLRRGGLQRSMCVINGRRRSLAGAGTPRLTLLLSTLGAPAVGQPLDSLHLVRDAVSARVSSAHAEAWSNADNRWVKPGETFAMAAIEGPGVVRHIWVTFPDSGVSWLSKEGSAAPDELVLRMYWDGAAEPAVESPLGDFFACGFGRRAEVNSTPVQVQGGDSYNCFWPMPFFASARITITNESERPFAAFYYHVDYTKETPPPDAAYFCAQYRQEFPCAAGRDYLLADIEAPQGGGHYVGTVLSVRSRSPQWFGEGDDKFTLDGEERPSIWGTGTEDYFLNAWGMERATFPAFGVTQLDGWLADLGEKGTMYRWHLADPVRFRRSLRVEVEHKGWMSADETTTGKVEGHVERGDDFSSVAFWYQRGQPKRFATLPPAKERRLPLIDAVYEGKTLLAQARAEGGTTSLQAGSFWTDEGQVFFDAGAVGSWIELPFEVERMERRRLVVPITHSYDFGIYRLLLDGEAAGEPVDFYSPKVEVIDHSLGDRELAVGAHVLRLECVGINPNSKGYKLGIDSVRLRGRWDVKRPPLGPR